MSDKFNIEMKSEELVNYFRRTPKQFAGELPGKLEEWCKNQYINEAVEALKGTPVTSIDDTARQEIATRIMVAHAPHAAVNVELLADYCVEAADELLKRLKR